MSLETQFQQIHQNSEGIRNKIAILEKKFGNDFVDENLLLQRINQEIEKIKKLKSEKIQEKRLSELVTLQQNYMQELIELENNHTEYNYQFQEKFDLKFGELKEKVTETVSDGLLSKIKSVFDLILLEKWEVEEMHNNNPFYTDGKNIYFHRKGSVFTKDQNWKDRILIKDVTEAKTITDLMNIMYSMSLKGEKINSINDIFVNMIKVTKGNNDIQTKIIEMFKTSIPQRLLRDLIEKGNNNVSKSETDTGLQKNNEKNSDYRKKFVETGNNKITDRQDLIDAMRENKGNIDIQNKLYQMGKDILFDKDGLKFLLRGTRGNKELQKKIIDSKINEISNSGPKQISWYSAALIGTEGNKELQDKIFQMGKNITYDNKYDFIDAIQGTTGNIELQEKIIEMGKSCLIGESKNDLEGGKTLGIALSITKGNKELQEKILEIGKNNQFISLFGFSLALEGTKGNKKLQDKIIKMSKNAKFGYEFGIDSNTQDYFGRALSALNSIEGNEENYKKIIEKGTEILLSNKEIFIDGINGIKSIPENEKQALFSVYNQGKTQLINKIFELAKDSKNVNSKFYTNLLNNIKKENTQN